MVPPDSIREHVDLIREVFMYANRFAGGTFVLHLDSEIVESDALIGIVKDLVILRRTGIRVALVPGASSRIDEVLERYGVTSRKVDGVRISSPEAVPFIKMAAFDVANRVMTLLTAEGENAVIGNWVRARSLGVRDGIDFQDTGFVEKIKIGLLENALEQDFIPIFPCVGWNAAGKPYNIGSLELAEELSSRIGADKLFFVSTFNGITSAEYDLGGQFETTESGRVPRMDLAEAAMFVEQNHDRRDDHGVRLVKHGYEAARNGVKRVHIVDGRIEGVLLKEIFSNLGIGTMIHANVYQSIRPMSLSDVSEVYRLMQPFVARGILIPRTEEFLAERCEDFIVYETDGSLHGCGALHTYSDGQAEIAAIAVDTQYEELGIGRKVVEYLMQRAAERTVPRVFALTTQSYDWFHARGFRTGTVEDLPPEKQSRYDRERNSRILLYDL